MVLVLAAADRPDYDLILVSDLKFSSCHRPSWDMLMLQILKVLMTLVPLQQLCLQTNIHQCIKRFVCSRERICHPSIALWICVCLLQGLMLNTLWLEYLGRHFWLLTYGSLLNCCKGWQPSILQVVMSNSPRPHRRLSYLKARVRDFAVILQSVSNAQAQKKPS